MPHDIPALLADMCPLALAGSGKDFVYLLYQLSVVIEDASGYGQRPAKVGTKGKVLVVVKCHRHIPKGRHARAFPKRARLMA